MDNSENKTYVKIIYMIKMYIFNNFDKCNTLTTNTSTELYKSECVNFMHDREVLQIYKKEFCMAPTHYCAILLNTYDDSHSQVSCSGAIVKHGKNVFNPITIKDLNFGDMLPLPMGWWTNGWETYYLKDVRMTFNSSLESIECFANYKTCVKTYEGASICFGNVQNAVLLDGQSSFLVAIVICLFVFTSNKLIFDDMSILNVIFPSIAIAILLNGFVILSPGMYTFGFIFTFLLLFFTISESETPTKPKYGLVQNQTR